MNNQQIQTVDTTQRDVTSFLISGTIFSATFAGSMNYSKYKKDKISKYEAIKETAKLGVQGGIGTGCAVSAANSIAKKNYLGALFAIGLGAVGVYATEKLYDKAYDKFANNNKNEIKEEKNDESTTK